MDQLSFDDVPAREPVAELPADEPETWLPVVGFEGLYEVSTLGRVNSFPRKYCRGGILKPYANALGYQYVTLTAQSVQTKHLVHRLVAGTFIGPCPDGQETLHKVPNPSNNRLSNLKYGTHKRNMEQMVEDGNGQVGKTHCAPRGHEFTPENTYEAPGGGRTCRACVTERTAEKFRLAREARPPTETHHCTHCGVPFEKSTRFGENRREYCSKECAQKAKQAARRRRAAASKKAAAA